ncbi:endonuclease/exonuclease/phosphatase family protein [Paludifilum halophilum]|nr:endonuclease/exonuclease/phosphatase family protein [Paludifilum halophilum]
MRVMSYNMHHGVGVDGQLNLKRIADVIGKEEPDLVGLNEVDICFHRRSRFEDQLARLVEMLGMEGVFGPSIQWNRLGNFPPRRYGNGLLFKGRLEESANHPVTGKGEEPRAVLTARIRREDRDVLVGVTHIGFTPWIRRAQQRVLTEQCLSFRGPVLVMGDWNVLPDHPAVTSLSPPLTDVLELMGVKEGTYPCSAPRKRIDYIFCSHHFRIRDGWVVQTPGCPSDHRPVVCDLEW